MQLNFEELEIKKDAAKVFQSEVECKIPDGESLKQVLSVCAHCVCLSAEQSDGEAKYNGRVVYNLAVVDAEGNLKNSECGVEFTAKFEPFENSDNLTVTPTVLNTTVHKTNGYYSLSSVIEAKAEAVAVEKTEYLKSSEDAFAYNCQTEYLRFLCFSKNTFDAEGEIELKIPVKSILLHSSSLLICDCQSGIGSIIVDGLINVTLLLLQNNEKNDIITETTQIPFRFELDAENAVPSMLAYARGAVEKTNIKVVVDEETGSSSVNCAVSICLYGELYESVYLEYAKDIYSVKNELNVEQKECSKRQFVKQYCTKARVFQAVETDFSGGDPIGVLRVITESLNVADGCRALEGVISAEVLIKDENGFRQETVKTPFRTDFECNLGCVYDISSIIESFEYRFKQGIELEVNLKIGVVEFCEWNNTFITACAEGEEKQQNESAISVYVANGNETLWDVSKELGVCPEAIMELNGDLQFPLNGDERIIVFRAL